MGRDSRFGRLLRGLDGAAFVDFVAALWRARGWQVTVDGATLVATREAPTERCVVFVDRRGRWVDRAPVEAPVRTVDTVVTRRRDPARAASLARSHGADLVDASDLRAALRYGVDAEHREALSRDHLGRSAAATLDPERGAEGRHRRHVVSVLGVVAVVALVVGAALLAPGASDAGGVPGSDVATPSNAGDGTSATADEAERDDSMARPPGVNASGRVEPFVLAGAHDSTLSSQSYTVAVERTVVGPNATLRTTTIVVRVAPDASAYHYVLTAAANGSFPLLSPVPRLEFWFDGDRTLVRYVREDGSVSFAKDATPGVGGPLRDPTDTQRVVAMFRAFPTVEVDRASDGAGDAVYRLHSTNLSEPDVLTAGGFQPWPVEGRPRNASLEARVDDEGVIHTYEVEFDARHDNRTVRVTRRVTYTGFGSTTVDRPDWYDRANETA